MPTAAPVLVVHDEIVVETDESSVQGAMDWLKTHMEAAAQELLPGVPVEVEVAWGKSWATEV